MLKGTLAIAKDKSGTTLRRSLVAAVVLMAAAACGAQPVNGAAASLAGTAWALHAIQSMDDAQGTTRIADPKRFTIRFGADGRASLRLDCNRATGQWKATPAADGVTGQLQFGPIAATRALCPPPHLDERVARDLGYVRGYLLKDGNLYMSLMADGGIYEWRPLRGD
jgi:heat shock protein HslJ